MGEYMEKTNAKEYLIEFAEDKESWIKAVIYEAINTNGNIQRETKDRIYNAFKNESELLLPSIAYDSICEGEKLVFAKLKHNHGVNAIQSNQFIKFSDDVTILYGMNGVGKSSYFKVLNELVGGNIKKNIQTNIFVDNPKNINVDIEYKLGEKISKIEGWKGNNRSLEILNQSRVFDTSYQNGLLAKHDVDELLLEPMGLNLFKYIADTFVEFKEKLNAEIEEKIKEKPRVDDQFFSEEVKKIFQEDILKPEIKQKVESCFEISDISIKRLDEISNEINTLKQENIQDKIKLNKNNKEGYEAIQKSIKNLFDKLTKYYNDSVKLIEEYKLKKSVNDAALKRNNILSDIPGTNTKEWKSFVEAGRLFSSKIDIDEEICPYCWQALAEDKSIDILKAYSSFLNDNSEKELIKVNAAISKLLDNLKSLKIEINIPSFIEREINDIKIADSSVLTIINMIIKDCQEKKEILIKAIENKANVNVFEIKNYDELILKLYDMIAYEELEIVKNNKSETEKKVALGKLGKEQIVIEENRAIANQRDLIKAWFDNFDEVNNLKSRESRLRTTAISRISKDTHEKLLTMSLRDAFNTELKKIGFANLDVEVISGGVTKGVASTRLVLKDIEAIDTILSEGEQKAVALALFIAEIKLQKNNCPIILDDPVNSLDHKIASTFAERLMRLDNQIILFTHNKLFLDAFEATKENHICKTVDTTCNETKGKHIKIYEVDSYGKSEKGILKNYKGTKLKSLLREAERELKKRPFEEHYKVGVIIRRAVEASIDEKILKGIIPTKLSNKNSRIRWDDLKQISIDSDSVNRLQAIHSRVSGSEMHNGTEADENPIDVEEFNGFIYEIKNITGIV